MIGYPDRQLCRSSTAEGFVGRLGAFVNVWQECFDDVDDAELLRSSVTLRAI